MPKRLTPLFVAVFPALLWMGCDDPVEPDDIDGEYGIYAADGMELPVFVAPTEQGCDEYITRGDLTLGEDRRYSLTVRSALDCHRDAGPLYPAGRRTFEGAYTVSDEGDLRLFATTEPAGTTALFTGNIRGDFLWLDVTESGLFPAVEVLNFGPKARVDDDDGLIVRVRR